MRKQYQSKRRVFLTRAAAAAALAVDGLLPAWARSMQITRTPPADANSPLVFDLAIREQAFDIACGQGNAMTINDSVPGPLLEWHEGRDVVLNVTNHMRPNDADDDGTSVCSW